MGEEDIANPEADDLPLNRWGLFWEIICTGHPIVTVFIQLVVIGTAIAIAQTGADPETGKPKEFFQVAGQYIWVWATIFLVITLISLGFAVSKMLQDRNRAINRLRSVARINIEKLLPQLGTRIDRIHRRIDRLMEYGREWGEPRHDPKADDARQAEYFEDLREFAFETFPSYIAREAIAQMKGAAERKVSSERTCQTAAKRDFDVGSIPCYRIEGAAGWLGSSVKHRLHEMPLKHVLYVDDLVG